MPRFTKVSRNLELEGTECVHDDGLGNSIKLTVARMENNPHYEATMTKLMSPYKKKMQKGTEISNEVAKKILVKALATDILLDWEKGVLKDDDGKPFEYSVDNAIELLEDDPDLRKTVEEFSADINNYIDGSKIAGKS